MKEENELILTDVAFFECRYFSEETKFGDPVRREGNVHYFSARFDGDLKKIRIGEGSGFSIFDREELIRYNKLGLIIPHNYEVIEMFYKNLER